MSYVVTASPQLLSEVTTQRPYVAVQLPVYNERYVVRRLVDACARMVEQYGIDNAEINILDDSNDDTVQLVDEIVSEYQQKNFHIHAQRRPDRQGYQSRCITSRS